MLVKKNKFGVSCTLKSGGICLDVYVKLSVYSICSERLTQVCKIIKYFSQRYRLHQFETGLHGAASK